MAEDGCAAQVQTVVGESVNKRYDIYVNWEKPRRFSVKMYGGNDATKRIFSQHVTVGVVALSVMTAIEAAQKEYPDYRIESVNDTGQVDIVADVPVRKPVWQPVPGEWVEIENGVICSQSLNKN